MMSASAQDPWRTNPPLGLVRHELGHAFCARHYGASTKIHHDGYSWRSDTTWPTKQPSEKAVAASWLGGMVAPEFMSGEDHLICGSLPSDMRLEVLTELEPVFELLRDLSDEKLRRMADQMVRDGQLVIE
jgi:hypothetical protein